MPSANRNEGEGAAGRSITVEMSEFEGVRAAFETLLEVLRTVLDTLRVTPGSGAMVAVLEGALARFDELSHEFGEIEELRVARETAVREALGRHMGNNFCEVCGSVINGVSCVCCNET